MLQAATAKVFFSKHYVVSSKAAYLTRTALFGPSSFLARSCYATESSNQSSQAPIKPPRTTQAPTTDFSPEKPIAGSHTQASTEIMRIHARMTDPKHEHAVKYRRGWIFEKGLTKEEIHNLDIGATEHREPKGAIDWIALNFVRSLRIPVHLFFRDRYLHHAVVLETVAAVPGMVAGMMRHLKSLRRMANDGGWIHHLLAEAENERMHLLTWMKITEPTRLERFLVFFVQGIYFNAFFVLYLLSPRLCHRIVGYLEEEALNAYTAMINDIKAGKIKNIPAPPIAIDYWNLPADSTLLEVAYAIRADEAQHRDVNHHFADRLKVRSEDLREPPKL